VSDVIDPTIAAILWLDGRPTRDVFGREAGPLALAQILHRDPPLPTEVCEALTAAIDPASNRKAKLELRLRVGRPAETVRTAVMQLARAAQIDTVAGTKLEGEIEASGLPRATAFRALAATRTARAERHGK
jgi:hypothetical protein